MWSPGQESWNISNKWWFPPCIFSFLPIVIIPIISWLFSESVHHYRYHNSIVWPRCVAHPFSEVFVKVICGFFYTSLGLLQLFTGDSFRKYNLDWYHRISMLRHNRFRLYRVNMFTRERFYRALPFRFMYSDFVGQPKLWKSYNRQ